MHQELGACSCSLRNLYACRGGMPKLSKDEPVQGYKVVRPLKKGRVAILAFDSMQPSTGT